MEQPEFVEFHAIEFRSDNPETTPFMVRVSEILTFQPMTQRIRREMMEAQHRSNQERIRQDLPPNTITEIPMTCTCIAYKRVAGPQQPAYSVSVWVEESYDEVKWMLGLVDQLKLDDRNSEISS